jgi:L-ascorbate metabolism protein UlaG (beta-lactamase superfamily)
MDIQFYGANCVVVTYKGTRLVIDDNLAEIGAKTVLKADDIALFTNAHNDIKSSLKMLIDRPGEYEVSDISIVGVAAQAHIDEKGTHAATMFKVTASDVSILFVGHVYPNITDSQLEAIGRVDVMFVPVGGNGYTLDPVGALKLIKEVEPKLVIPTHYADKDLEYPVPQQDLEQALRELSMEPKETVPRLKLKAGELGEVTQLVILEKS